MEKGVRLGDLEVVSARVVASERSDMRIEGMRPVTLFYEKPSLRIDIRYHGSDLEDVRLVWKIKRAENKEIVESNLSSWKSEKEFSIAKNETHTYKSTMKKRLVASNRYSVEVTLRKNNAEVTPIVPAEEFRQKSLEVEVTLLGF